MTGRGSPYNLVKNLARAYYDFSAVFEKSFNFYQAHLVKHYVDMLITHGLEVFASTKKGEAGHKANKTTIFRQTNRKDPLRQVLCFSSCNFLGQMGA